MQADTATRISQNTRGGAHTDCTQHKVGHDNTRGMHTRELADQRPQWAQKHKSGASTLQHQHTSQDPRASRIPPPTLPPPSMQATPSPAPATDQEDRKTSINPTGAHIPTPHTRRTRRERSPLSGATSTARKGCSVPTRNNQACGAKPNPTKSHSLSQKLATATLAAICTR